MCGQAEFYGMEASTNTASAFIVNVFTSLTNGVIDVNAYNPKHKELSWVQNTRIKNITLEYRKSGSRQWSDALDVNGNPAEFFDDVRAYMFHCMQTPMHA